jgi:hypothetical protein
MKCICEVRNKKCSRQKTDVNDKDIFAKEQRSLIKPFVFWQVEIYC